MHFDILQAISYPSSEKLGGLFLTVSEKNSIILQEVILGSACRKLNELAVTVPNRWQIK